MLPQLHKKRKFVWLWGSTIVYLHIKERAVQLKNSGRAGAGNS